MTSLSGLTIRARGKTFHSWYNVNVNIQRENTARHISGHIHEPGERCNIRQYL